MPSFLVSRLSGAPSPLKSPTPTWREAVIADYALSARFVEGVMEARFGTARFEMVRAELLHLREEARALGATLDIAEAELRSADDPD